MNPQINILVQSLLKKDSLDQCSVQELQLFADRHPYFGAAQLLLTKKLQTENHKDFNVQLQKTFLYFNNPLWVEQLLNETGTVSIIPIAKEVVHENTVTPPDLSESKSAESPVKNEIKDPHLKDPFRTLKSFQIEQAENKSKEFLFQPYHTVDYFASQGIKFSEEEKPKDKFGQQLRSFTEWLKTMKRLPVSEISVNLEPQAEQKVEQLAEHSLENKEVLTEAMAEVWDKQGNTAKALEIYTKLSLLEPSKSVYFASKIEELKKRI